MRIFQIKYKSTSGTVYTMDVTRKTTIKTLAETAFAKEKGHSLQIINNGKVQNDSTTVGECCVDRLFYVVANNPCRCCH